MKGGRQKQRDGRHRPESGQNPDQCPDQHPDEAKEQIDRLKGHSQAEKDMVQDIHKYLLNIFEVRTLWVFFLELSTNKP
jgi:hypothetical protein